MTKFEQIGMGLQLSAETPAEAHRQFAYSCRVCCNRGMRIDCDCCAISSTHQQVLGIFRDVEAAKRAHRAKESEKFSVQTEIAKLCPG